MSDVLGAVAKMAIVLAGLEPAERPEALARLALVADVALDAACVTSRASPSSRDVTNRVTSDGPLSHAERQRRYRERHCVTKSDATCVTRDGESDDGDAPCDASVTPFAPSLSDFTPSVPLSSPRVTPPETPRASDEERFPMPAEWPLTAEARAMVDLVGVRDVEATWGKFVVYWHARGDANTARAWLGLWARKWCVDERNRQRRVGSAGMGAKPLQPASLAWSSEAVSLDDEPPVAAGGRR